MFHDEYDDGDWPVFIVEPAQCSKTERHPAHEWLGKYYKHSCAGVDPDYGRPQRKRANVRVI